MRSDDVCLCYNHSIISHKWLVVLKEVAVDRGLPLVEDKEKRLINRNSWGKRGLQGMAEKVKWLGVILNQDLDFRPHLKYRIPKARGLLRARDGVGSNRLQICPLSWRQVYARMIKSEASWALKVV